MGRKKLEQGEKVVVYETKPGSGPLTVFNETKGEVVREEGDEVAIRVTESTKRGLKGNVIRAKRSHVAGLGGA